MKLIKKHAVTGVMFVISLLLLFGGDDKGKISNVTNDADMLASGLLALEDQAEKENSGEEGKQPVVKNVEFEQKAGELPQAYQEHNEKYYSVIKVIDGDTVNINKEGETVTLRLIGLDTPETVHPSKPVECFGKEASDEAKAVLASRRVWIETDPSQGTYDKYGRMLAYVYLEDGKLFNKYMIEEGYGYEYTYDLPYKHQAEFKQAQKEAEANKRGLWALNVCDVAVEELSAQQELKSADMAQEQAVDTGDYICSDNVYNCGDFSTHLEAQTAYDACGGVNNDIHRLDQDKDGSACESLP